MRRQRTIVRLLALVSALLVVPAAILMPTPAATALNGSHVAPGLGRWIAGGTDFVGFYRALVDGKWTKVYCVRPESRAPAVISLRTVSRLPDTSTQATRQLAETLAAHGDARTEVQAAAVSQALNEEIGNHLAVRRRAASLPDRVQALADRYVAEARAMLGPYRLAIELAASPLPGQSARGTVTLRSAAGPAPGTVALRHTANVTSPDRVHVGPSGRARFTYATVAGGPVHIAATAEVPPTTLRASHPSAGTQLMVSWSAPHSVRATATYEGRGPRIAYRYACDSQCDGHPVVTLTACAPRNRYRSQITFWLADGVRRITFPAAEGRACQSLALAVADGVSVSATWRYETPHGWSRPLPAEGAFVVDCPAPPPVAAAVSSDCNAARLSVALGTEQHGSLRRANNTTTHRMVLVVSGSVSGRYVVEPGATATVLTFGFACGTGAAVTVRSGVQRADGTYNYGDPVEVAMP